MLSLIYLSYATVPFSSAELDALLAKSRDNNQRDNISGMLVFRDGDFLQVLEGPEDAVRKTYMRIAQDKRHGRIMVLDESKIEARSFADWSMGFRRLSREDAPAGFVDFFDRKFNPETLAERGSEALQYLLSFRDIAR